MRDLISRQAAIDTLCDNCDHVEAVCPHYPCKQYIAIENLPSAQPDNRLEKIADIVEGTIDHLDRDDAMDMLYQIKEVLK